jgi:hypothetical protein
MTSARVPEAAAVGQRCGAQLGKVRRGLFADHDGLHAAATPTTCITWKRRDVRYWGRNPAAAWLAALPWVEGHGLP